MKDSLERYTTPVSPQNAPRTYFEEQYGPYVKYMLWDTAEADKQQALFWMTAHKYDKCMPSGFLTRLLEWAAHKERNGTPLHVKQVVRAMHKQMLTRKAKGLL